MRILYIHQYFKTPREPGGTRSYWVSQELLKRGYAVTVLTARAGQMAAREENMVDGIRVISFRVPYSQNMGIKQRLSAFTDFMLRATKEGLKHHDVDLVIATSTPLTVGVPALILKWFKKTPYIFEVRDLWPEVPIQMGAFKSPLIVKLTRWFEKTIYKNAEHVITLSPGMQDGVVKYITKTKTSMIPNMAKKDEFWPREKDYELMGKLGLKSEALKIIHFGALGIANGADAILETAKLMKDDASVQFVFLGGGSTERKLKTICQKENLKNVIFLPKTPMKETSKIVNCCDVSIISFKDIPILYTNSPNKLFDSLSAGKPIIVNSAGWTKDLVEEGRCGFYVDPNQPRDLADKLVYLKCNPTVCEEMGRHARKLAEEKYDKSILTIQFAQTIEKLNLNRQ